MPHGRVVALIAGGREAMFEAVEGAEDSERMGLKDIEDNNVTSLDTVVGITASGRTPYVLAACKAAGALGALTVGLSNTAGSALAELCDIAITPVAGPEALTGSTRMKAGTTQKMVLNMLSTGVMIKLGKSYSNLMVDVMPTNEKLVDRAIRIVCEAAEVDYATAKETLESCGMRPKEAILTLKNAGQETILAE
jgi:N-acetylmuramic acid 6-phosphate etherase